MGLFSRDDEEAPPSGGHGLLGRNNDAGGGSAGAARAEFESEPGMRPDRAPDFVFTLTPQQVAEACLYWCKQWRVPIAVLYTRGVADAPQAPVTVKLWKAEV
jgi:hypothetical protein